MAQRETEPGAHTLSFLHYIPRVGLIKTRGAARADMAPRSLRLPRVGGSNTVTHRTGGCKVPLYFSGPSLKTPRTGWAQRLQASGKQDVDSGFVLAGARWQITQARVRPVRPVRPEL